MYRHTTDVTCTRIYVMNASRRTTKLAEVHNFLSTVVTCERIGHTKYIWSLEQKLSPPGIIKVFLIRM